jgi:hypothetical protein
MLGQRGGIAALVAATLGVCASPALAVDGGTLRVTPRNGWKAFEVISVGNDPVGGDAYAMPSTFDGIGAYLSNASTLRLLINHENADATVSEVNLNLVNFHTAISNTIAGGSTGSFVTSARKAFDQWSNNGGTSFSTTGDTSANGFSRFCSSQLHPANTFGANRGFVDNIYMTGAEISGGRMFALDTANRNMYRLGSATVGVAPGGISTAGNGGMPAGPWENAALLDTGEANHVAILMSPDDGSTAQPMQLYIGQKGKDFNGNSSNSFLARNGLAYGNYYYLNGTLPSALPSSPTNGTIDATIAGALSATKLEDVDTNPNDPTQAVIGVQESGLFTFDFALDFAGGSFSAAGSTFSLTRRQNHANDTDGAFGDADNVDWTKATTLNGVTYSDGLIFVNEDTGTANGETWIMKADGSGLLRIADTNDGLGSTTETSGILDISELVGYMPGSILLTSNQGSASSLSVLINPNATLIPEPSSLAVLGLAGLLLKRRPGAA